MTFELFNVNSIIF